MSQKLNETNNIINENINIIYYQEKDDKEESDTDINKIENLKIFEFPAPKSKNLLKIFIEEEEENEKKN